MHLKVLGPICNFKQTWMSSHPPPQPVFFYDGNWLSQHCFVAGTEISAQFVKVFSGPLTEGFAAQIGKSQHNKSPFTAGAPLLSGVPELLSH